MRIPFLKHSVSRDIDDELRFHFEARIDELVKAGATPDAARAQALSEFGDVNDVRSGLREIDARVARRRQRAEWFDVLRQDATYAIRSLRRTPAVTITIVVTLALGLGINAAMFSFLDAVFLRPPAEVVRPRELRRLWVEKNYSSGRAFSTIFGFAAYSAVQERFGTAATVATYRPAAKAPLGAANDRQAYVSSATSSYFAALGVRPALGRFYGADEDMLMDPAAVAVISDAFWHREFGGDANALGQQLVLRGKPFTIIGVAPPNFIGVDLDATDVWRPIAWSTDGDFGDRTPWYRNPNVNGFQIIFRLSDAVREPEFEQRATAALRQPGIGWTWDTTKVVKFGSIIKARGPGKIEAEVQVATRLGGVAVIVFIIACANVVNLLLARAVRRRREIAVRLALGIARGRLVRLLVTESVLLALAAAAAALAAATWAGAALRHFLLPNISWAAESLHWRVALFGLGIALVAGVMTGLVPALQSRAPDLTAALRAGSRQGGAVRSRLRGTLVAMQAALAVVLLVGAGLFIRSLQNVRALDIGYRVDRLAFVGFADFRGDAERSTRLLQLRERLAAIPGVDNVAFASIRPVYGIQFLDHYFPEADTIAHKKPEGIYTSVSPEYFSTTGMRLIRGRSFEPGERGEFNVVVNQAFAEALWPGEDPIGRCIRVNEAASPCVRIIGMVQTAMLDAIREKPSPHLYFPIGNMSFKSWGAREAILRIDPRHMTNALTTARAMIASELPNHTLAVTTMTAAMEPEYRPWRLGATLFSLFGGLAAIVAAIGIYSTVSYAVSQRTHEFGVRAALGADASNLLRHVVGDGLRAVLAGVAAGIVLAVGAGRLIASLLYGITPGNPWAMMAAGTALVVVAVLASLGPAWRASRADPAAALRAD